MKTNIILNIMLASSMAFLGGCASSNVGQQGEYDDLYYTSSDRRVPATESVTASRATTPAPAPAREEYYTNDSQSNETYSESEAPQEQAYEEGEGDAYYDENYDGSRNVPSPSSYTSNRYSNINSPDVGWVNSGFGFYNDPFYYDPFFYDPYVVRRSFYAVRPSLAFGFGWNSWSGWGMSVGYGYGYGSPWGYSPWGFHDPFYSPYGYYSPYGMHRGGFYDPFWGGNRWGHNNYMAGYYHGYHDRSIISSNSGSGNRVVTNRPRNDRSSNIIGGRNAVNQGAVVNGGRGSLNNGRTINGGRTTNDVTPGRSGRVMSAPSTGRGTSAEPADVRPARDVRVIRPERAIDRPSRTNEGNTRPTRTMEAPVRGGDDAPVRPSRREYYRESAPTINTAPERQRPVESTPRPTRQEYNSPRQSPAPSRREVPMQRSTPSYSSPSRQAPVQRSTPSREYSAPSRSSSPSYSAPAPSRSTSPAPSSRPSRGRAD